MHDVICFLFAGAQKPRTLSDFNPLSPIMSRCAATSWSSKFCRKESNRFVLISLLRLLHMICSMLMKAFQETCFSFSLKLLQRQIRYDSKDKYAFFLYSRLNFLSLFRLATSKLLPRTWTSPLITTTKVMRSCEALKASTTAS